MTRPDDSLKPSTSSAKAPSKIPQVKEEEEQENCILLERPLEVLSSLSPHDLSRFFHGLIPPYEATRYENRPSDLARELTLTFSMMLRLLFPMLNAELNELSGISF